MVTVISLPDIFEQEAEWITRLFDAGMEHFHLRKPNASESEVEELLKGIPKNYHSKIVIHYNVTLAEKYDLGGIHLSGTQEIEIVHEGFLGTVSKSCHSFEEVEKYDAVVNYMFLSPVRSSISKEGYHPAWTDDQLRSMLIKPRKSKIVALGGIDANNATEVLSFGFDGVAILGALWSADNLEEAVESFKKIRSTCLKAGHIR